MSTSLTLSLALALVSLQDAPPSGRPPTGPLQRLEPRAYQMSFQVTISTVVYPDARNRVVLGLQDTPIIFPIIYQSTYSAVDPASISAALWTGADADATLMQRLRVDGGFPYNSHMLVIPVPTFEGQALRWQARYTAKVWSSRLNERGAAAIAWPREWPAEVQDGLKPQMFVESDLPIFAAAVEKVSAGQLRLVPPFLAAKDLLRYCITSIRVSGDGIDRTGDGWPRPGDRWPGPVGNTQPLDGFVHGLEMHGAAWTVESGIGSPHDLVCVCVATLRAAGIPARPVIGITENDKGTNTFVSWAEFYLPEAGWIPFDPMELRGQGLQTRNVRDTWKGLGTLDDLNRRVPLAYHFIPPASVQTPQAPAVWGWDPRPSGAPDAQQYINVGLTSRGRVASGPEDR